MGIYGATTTNPFDRLTPHNLVGLSHRLPDSGQHSVSPGIAQAAGPGKRDMVQPWHPDSGLFWFGVLAAVTFGLVAASTNVRVGPLKASVAAGK